ncbi:[NiFe]-hydrogenase assembly chaperone HybE [Sphaerotilus natans]|uniref:[NiFe]-hydrogenase assembly chaperone HybE n=1 Tax=Sphaerotilus natans TaxID=34103 RepID=UPI00406BF9AC
MSDDAPQRRLAGLEAVFRRIATTRMRGVPVLNPALSVQAIGFGPDPLRTAPDAAPTMLGVLVTPWFMNLLRLPLQPVDGRDAAALQAAGLAPLGRTVVRRYGEHALDFTGAHEAGEASGFSEAPGLMLGAWEQASLFSPMFAFADQPAAVATAREVMRLLRQSWRETAPPPAPPRHPREGEDPREPAAVAVVGARLRGHDDVGGHDGVDGPGRERMR